jgi:hypothetical protein
VILWICVGFSLVGFIRLLRGRPPDDSGGMIFSVAWIAFVLLVGAVLLFGKSDVLIDDQGISRRLFGWTWLTIQWANVRLITAFPVSGGYGYSARAFNIFPTVKAAIRLMPSGKMAFTDKVSGAPRLVELLNHYASSHRINIEIRDSLMGGLKPASRL